GGREITINTPGRPSEGVFGEYEITLQPPVVNITEPVVNSTIRREAGISGEDNVPTFDITHIRVVAEATWADGYPRLLENAKLYVDDELEDTAELTPGMSQFEFDWDHSDVTTEGLNSVSLEVRVEDELGLTAADTAQVNVEVVIPENLNSFWSRLSPTWTAIGAVVICLGGILVLGAIGGGLYFYTKRSSSAGADEEADLDEVMPTIFAADTPEFVLATLTVLEGPSGLIGELFKISTFVTTLGRDPSQTDIAFYPDEASSVSRVHCLIELDDDNSFRITDHDTPSGTRLNGRALKPDVAVVLADEDEIVLGSLTHRGVKLRFNFPPKESDGPVLGDADDRTHLLGDQDLSEWDGILEE
ncbi:MAG: FHA domain-containing protein, partial [Anaerolineales bacterium]|nr:FHA domain-containing protein [Anaerolineales bacterium]